MKIYYVAVVIASSLMVSACVSNNKYADRKYSKCSPIKLYEYDFVDFLRSVGRDHTYSIGVRFIYKWDKNDDFSRKFSLLAKLDPEAIEKCKISPFPCPVVKNGMTSKFSELRLIVKIVNANNDELVFNKESTATLINNGSFGVIDMPFEKFNIKKGNYKVHVENIKPSPNFIGERSCIYFSEETHK